jgi:hypothetical protein
MIAALMSLAPQLSIETTWRVLAELLACAYYSPPIWLLARQSIPRYFAPSDDPRPAPLHCSWRAALQHVGTRQRATCR